jgi:hypothetical protein
MQPVSSAHHDTSKTHLHDFMVRIVTTAAFRFGARASESARMVCPSRAMVGNVGVLVARALKGFWLFVGSML